MGGKKGPGGAIGKGGVNSAASGDGLPVRMAAEQLITVPIDALVPYANNARVHSKAQIAQLRASLRKFGFVTPVLIDFDNNIIAGHGRVAAARAEGMAEVPCVLVSNLTEAQRKAYILADNRLCETGTWDAQLLKLEIAELEKLSFDTGIIGFDAAALEAFPIGGASKVEPGKSVSVGSYTRAAPGLGAEGAPEPVETEEYRAFVDKFKPKLTTDDCYTPENVYQAVKDWAVRHYGLEGRKVLRPFYPGGDYQGAEYPEGCVVIDNPPFSILSEICRWYSEREIPYFLFAPTLTLFSVAAGGCNYVLAGVGVTYENGAVVNSSFVTNLGAWKIETAPELYRLVKAADDANRHEAAAELPGYMYPPEVLTSAVCRLAKYGQTLQIRAVDAVFVRALDAQRAEGKAIFGSGFLLSEQATVERTAVERAAAERAAVERAAAERAAVERAAAERAAATKWALSDRERALVQSLGEGEGRSPGMSKPRPMGGARDMEETTICQDQDNPQT